MSACVAGLYCVGGILSLFVHKSYPIILGVVLEAAGCVVLSTGRQDSRTIHVTSDWGPNF